jgi:hypothetical protein
MRCVESLPAAAQVLLHLEQSGATHQVQDLNLAITKQIERMTKLISKQRGSLDNATTQSPTSLPKEEEPPVALAATAVMDSSTTTKQHDDSCILVTAGATEDKQVMPAPGNHLQIYGTPHAAKLRQARFHLLLAHDFLKLPLLQDMCRSKNENQTGWEQILRKICSLT